MKRIVAIVLTLIVFFGMGYGLYRLLSHNPQRDEKIAVVVGIVEEAFRGEFKTENVLKKEYYVEKEYHNDNLWYKDWLEYREDKDWTLSVYSTGLSQDLYDEKYRKDYPTKAICDFDCCTHPYGYDCDDRIVYGAVCALEKNENGMLVRHTYNVSLVAHRVGDSETEVYKLADILLYRTEVFDSEGNIVYGQNNIRP